MNNNLNTDFSKQSVQINKLKETQHHYSSGKCKSKPQ